MGDRQSQILEAAARLMGERGFTQTSVDDVIRAAGLSGKAHFYHYFKSKEELGYAVLECQVERFTERGLDVLREPMIEPLERLHLFIDSLVSAHAQRGCRGGSPFGSLAAEMADSHEGFRQRIDLMFERWTRQLQALLWEARPRLMDHVDVPRLSRFIMVTLEGAILMSRVRRDITVLEEVAEDLKRFVATHVREDAEVVRTPAVRSGAGGLVVGDGQGGGRGPAGEAR